MKDLIMNLSIKQKVIICLIFAGIILIGFIFVYKYYYSNEENIIVSETNEEISNNNANDMDEYNEDNNKNEVYDSDNSNNSGIQSRLGITKEENKIKIYVVGEVNSPGVVSLNEKSRIVDAINACGGKTENADLTKINLAYVLEDGTQIYVPRIGEKTDSEGTQSYIRDDAGDGVISDEVVSDNNKKIKVNINKASPEKLQTIPGIGEVTAQKIISYRNEKGKFKSIEDIKNVSGIGDAKYEKIKDYIET